MLHHVSVGSRNIQNSRAFYQPTLAVLGLRLMKDLDRALDFGTPALEYIFSVETPVNDQPASAGNGVHIAFHASSRSVVDEFYRVALASGGKDAGAPGYRAHYDANYYGAFVMDPDGNKIEAVTFAAKS